MRDLAEPLAPGSTIGILGGGQLARMMAMAAARLGYRVHVLAPEPSGPAADVCARWVRADYDDAAALEAFANGVSRITYEFENLPVTALERLERMRPVHPPARSLAVAQDRIAEKRFVGALGGRTARWAAVDDAGGLEAAVAEVGLPAICKTTRLGYDGKGQARIADARHAADALAAIGGGPAILEAVVPFEDEFSIVLVRGADGAMLSWDPPANVHRDGILHLSTVPAGGRIGAQRAEAEALARQVAEALGHVGVLTLEFFAGADGPVFNEMAPRVHNSGHWTIEGAATSQFENHVRAVCGLPLGAVALAGRGATMLNLIGDEADGWLDLLRDGEAHLHLYGKTESRPGRKMGHVTRVVR